MGRAMRYKGRGVINRARFTIHKEYKLPGKSFVDVIPLNPTTSGTHNIAQRAMGDCCAGLSLFRFPLTTDK